MTGNEEMMLGCIMNIYKMLIEKSGENHESARWHLHGQHCIFRIDRRYAAYTICTK